MNSITSIENDAQQTVNEGFRQNSPFDDSVNADVTSQNGSRTDSDERRVYTQYPSFKSMLMTQQAALLSLSPQQLELLLKFAETLRRQRIAVQKHLECAFCKNNGRPQSWYSTHVLKDWRGRVLCPVLRAYTCPRCGATGDRAHTISYCPKIYNPDCRTRYNF